MFNELASQSQGRALYKPRFGYASEKIRPKHDISSEIPVAFADSASDATN